VAALVSFKLMRLLELSINKLFLDRSRLLVVMELMEGGELFTRISKQKCLTENQASRYTKQVCLHID